MRPAPLVTLALGTVLVVGGAGCTKTRPCEAGTLLLDLTLDSASAAADTLAVQVALPDRTLTASGAHTPGVRHGTLQVLFAGPYLAGQTATIAVTALVQGATVGHGATAATTLPPTCARIPVAITAMTATMDMATADLTVAGDMQPGTPRLLSPLSTAHVTSQQPTLRWTAGGGGGSVQVDLCQDRACATPLGIDVDLGADGSSATPRSMLPAGVLFWRVRLTGGGQTNSSATWQLTVGKRSAAFSSSWGAVLDVDGDGYAEVVGGSPFQGSNAGRAHLYYGSAAGPKLDASALVLDPPASDPSGAQFGTAFGAADVDGDGFVDLIVGAPGGVGNVNVYRGSAAGLVTTNPQTLTSPDQGGAFGSAVAGVGDVDGDGYADVVVGEPGFANTTGKAFLYRGGPAGLGSSPIAILAPTPAGSRFGHAIAGGGDFNGDGYSDLVISADLTVSGGSAYLYVGGAGGITAAAPVLISTPSTGEVGCAVAFPGDVNGDGYSDILIGAYTVTPGANNNAGAAFLVFGGTGSTQTANIATVNSPDGANSDFGTCVGGNGDVNGDGYDDVVIGAQFANITGDANQSGSGAAHVFYGGVAGLLTTSTPIPSPDGYNAQMGVACAGVGDDNGDGFSDIVVGAASATFAGAVHVYQGASAGPQLGVGNAGIAITSDNGEFGLAVY